MLAVLPPSGMPRACMLQGLRSIFGILKGRKLVFVNPAARISAPQPARQAPAAVDLEALRAALDSADPPAPCWPRCWPSTPCASTSCARCG